MAYGRITKKQTEILEYIKSQILNKGYPPSVRMDSKGNPNTTVL